MPLFKVLFKCLCCQAKFYSSSKKAHHCQRECTYKLHVDFCDTCVKLSVKSFEHQLQRTT